MDSKQAATSAAETEDIPEIAGGQGAEATSGSVTSPRSGTPGGVTVPTPLTITDHRIVDRPSFEKVTINGRDPESGPNAAQMEKWIGGRPERVAAMVTSPSNMRRIPHSHAERRRSQSVW